MTKKEFTLRHLFKDVEKLEEETCTFSPEEEHFGVKWKINIESYNGFFGCWLVANKTKNKEIHANCTMKIFSKNKEKCHSKSRSFSERDADCGEWGWKHFIEWKTVKNDYLDDGKLEVEIQVKITKMIGFPKEELISFGEEMKQFSDVLLKVKEQKFYVSKLYLSTHSPYFTTLFLGKFQESEKSEIELKDVDSQAFQYYLEVLYGYKGIDEDTVEGILSVADMYNTPLLVEKCEAFLVKESKMELKKKLELAGNYRLEELKIECLNQIKSKADIRSVVPEDPRELGVDILAELFEKALAYN